MTIEEYTSIWEDLVQTDSVLSEMFESGSVIEGITEFLKNSTH